MGSLEKAIKTGFICRLCSEMNKVVIHIYSDVGRKLKLAERIHEYLPVTVTVQDPLPKTVCRSCIERLEQQHLLMQRIKMSHERVIMRVRGEVANNARTTSSAPATITSNSLVSGPTSTIVRPNSTIVRPTSTAVRPTSTIVSRPESGPSSNTSSISRSLNRNVRVRRTRAFYIPKPKRFRSARHDNERK